MAMRPAAPAEVKPLAKASVLLVEDSKFVVDIVTRSLRLMPVGQVLTAASAEDALYNLEKSGGLADVLILDHGLGGMDGLHLLEKLRRSKDEKLQRLPVVVLTGHNDMVLFQQMADLRISGFLVKPVSHDVLKAALERALQGDLVARPRITGGLPAAPVSDDAPPKIPAAPASLEDGDAAFATHPDATPQEPPAEPAPAKPRKRGRSPSGDGGKVDLAV